MKLIPPTRVAHIWGDMLPVLQRALKFDPDTDAMTIFGDLVSSRRQAWEVQGGYMLTEFTRKRGTLRKTLWVTHVAGNAKTPLSALTDALMGQLEALARENKCVDIKIMGRKGWKRLLPGFSAHIMGDGRYELRKALT